MTSNPGEVKITIPCIEELDTIEQEKARLLSALQEAKRLQLAQREPKDRGSGSSQKTKIQRVPSVLKDVKADFKQYFEPRLVALGPFHHRNPKFTRSQEIKRRFAALFADENETTGENLFNKIKADIDNLKECYDSEDIKDYNDDKLAWMFFVDGSAVLYAVHYGMEGKFDKLGTKADHLVFAQLDLFLLENQFPYRVLQILIQSTKNPQMWKESITKFIDRNLITNIPGGKCSQHTKKAEDYSHLLQLLRNNHLMDLQPPEKHSCRSMIRKMLCCCCIGKMFLFCGKKKGNKKTFRSIKELKESGILVQPSKSNSLKDISFHCNIRGSLKMPRLMVDDSTASKFMNLVALEMCPDFHNDFALTSYLCFMDTLIDTAQDVKELRAAGVLQNYLGSDEEVANLFNKMSKNLVPDQSMYRGVKENLNNYYNNEWLTNAFQAYYAHFSNPWTCLGFSAAILGLLFSAVQAYCSLFGC